VRVAQGVTLDRVPSGSRVIVRQIIGGAGVHTRLLQMGIVPGEVIEVISNNAGPVVIKVRGTIISIGRGIARKIIVEKA